MVSAPRFSREGVAGVDPMEVVDDFVGRARGTGAGGVELGAVGIEGSLPLRSLLATTVRGLHRESGEGVEVPEGTFSCPRAASTPTDACLPPTEMRFYMICKLIMKCQGVRRGF